MTENQPPVPPQTPPQGPTPNYQQQPPMPPEGAPGAPYGYGQPPAAPPKKKLGLQQIISIVVVAALVIAGGYYLFQQFATQRLLQEGNCVVLGGTTTKPEINEAKCDDKTVASYQIVKVLKDGTSCHEDYTEYYVTNKGKRTASYCLMENLFEGQCYNNPGMNPANLKVVSCTATNAYFKVFKRFDNTVDEAKCGADGNPLAFQLGNRTYCIGKP